MIAAADAELRQQKADIERQRMEEELVRVAADQEEDDQGHKSIEIEHFARVLA